MGACGLAPGNIFKVTPSRTTTTTTKEYNNLPLLARKIESRLVFRIFLDSHFNEILIV